MLPKLESLVRTTMAVVGQESRVVSNVSTRQIKVRPILSIAEAKTLVSLYFICEMLCHLPNLRVVVDVVDCRAFKIPLSCKVRDIAVFLALDVLSVSYILCK